MRHLFVASSNGGLPASCETCVGNLCSSPGHRALLMQNGGARSVHVVRTFSARRAYIQCGLAERAQYLSLAVAFELPLLSEMHHDELV